jgi:hypothetical protein
MHTYDFSAVLHISLITRNGHEDFVYEYACSWHNGSHGFGWSLSEQDRLNDSSNNPWAERDQHEIDDPVFALYDLNGLQTGLEHGRLPTNGRPAQ